MPSSYTVNVRFEQQFTGENINLWGGKLNDALARIDDAIAGFVAIAITGSYSVQSANTNTTADEARRAHLKFTGALTTGATITLPSVSKSYQVWNASGQTLTFTTGAGNTYAIENGDIAPIWCDGANVKGITYGGYDLKTYITSQTASAGAVPGVIGNAGKYLYTDAASAFWRQIVPSDIATFSASASQVWVGSSAVVAITPASAIAASAVTTLTDAATITPDLDLGANFTVTLGGNRTLANPTHLQQGKSGVITVKQDGTGSRTLVYGAGWKFPGGTPALSTAASAVDTIAYYVEDASTPVIRAVMAKAYS